MGDDSRLEGKIKAQITRFASRLTDGWASPGAPGSNIARSLNEKVRLIKTENRLCRNLACEDLTERINRYLAWEGAGVVQEDTVLALDLGDLRKEYAKAMEHLATVRDGSTGSCSARAADPRRPVTPANSSSPSPNRPREKAWGNS